MSTPEEQIKSIFLNAAEIAGESERSAYLDERCGDDAELRREIDELLRHQKLIGTFLESSPVGAATLDHPVTEKPGTQIGPYKLLQQLGEGGMGVVYMAEQKEPVKRRVALKIIKPGMDTRQVIARFEAERQALSLMDHPNIARVLDAGTTDSGRPYFVMELVNGIPVTQFCDEQHLTARERLELFIPICQAVQHAHQKGIIHRDIKPSNILVALYDGRPVPKVIDFGVAKATGGQLTEKTMFTGLGQIIGTLEYMSPEQAQRNQLDIDTRSDVYSLGVVLYELLTGDTPFDRQRLRSAALDEMLRIIREEEPPKPSTRLSKSRDSLPSVSAQRQTEPAKLTKLVRGELDWIVMKALDKDRARRYETAIGLANDVQHYLRDEPVQACPPSTGYRLWKFARRNKGAVLAVSAVLVALAVGIIGTTLGLVRARAAAEAEARQRQEAEASQKKASEEAAIVKAVKEFLQRDLLGRAGAAAQLEAKIEPDPNVKLTTLLDRAAAMVDQRFGDQPTVRAEVQDSLARAYDSIGRCAEAVRLWEQVVPYCQAAYPEHPDTLAVMNSLAQAYGSAGQYRKALELAQQTLELKQKILGLDHRGTLNGMNTLASIYRRLGQHADALKLQERTLARRMATLGRDHPDTLASMHDLANTYEDLGRHADALELREQILSTRKRTHGLKHPETLASMESVANSYVHLSRYADALELHDQTLAMLKVALGPDHPATLSGMHNLAFCYWSSGRYTDALKLHEETLALRKTRLGAAHPETLLSMSGIALCYGNLGRHADALKLQQETLALAKEKLGPDHPQTLRSMGIVADSYFGLRRYEEALKLREEAFALRKATLGPNHPDTLTSMRTVAVSYRALGRHGDALKLFEEALEIHKAQLGPDHRNTFRSMVGVAAGYSDLGRHAEALQLFQETLGLQKAKLGAEHPDTLETMGNVATCLLNLGQHAEALQLRQETLAICRSTLGTEHPRTLESMWRVTESLVQQHRDSEAVPMIDEFLKGAVGKSMRPDMIARMVFLRSERRATDAAGSRAMAEMFENLAPTDATSRYNIACARASTAAQIRAGDQSEGAAKEAAAETDRAMVWLTQAVAAGFKDIHLMKTDKDLDALRYREDFRKLLAELEASAKP